MKPIPQIPQIPEPLFLDLHLSIVNEFVSSQIYDKRDDFAFDMAIDGDVPRLASYGAYISQLIRFVRACNHVTDFNMQNKCLTARCIGIINFEIHFLNFIVDSMN